METEVSMNTANYSTCSIKPRVTIGVCVRNCETYLKDTLESIMAQDYPHELLEIIFVDDGSKDNTLSIVQDYVSGIDISAKVFHTPWRGLGSARNLVVANAETEYILWVDGDMVLSKDFVRKLVKFMEQNPHVGIAKGKQALQLGGNLLGTLETFARAAGRLVDYQSEKSRLKSLGTGGAIYRVKALRETEGFDERLKGYGEDQDIEIRIRAAGWNLQTVSTWFLDYERHGLTWKNLWRRYWLRGYFTHYFLHKNKGAIKHYRMFPPAAFFSGLFDSFVLYKLTRRKIVFLLPFQFIFKFTGWYAGYLRGHTDSYEPKSYVSQ